MQQLDLEAEVSNEEIKKAVWDCGVDKSPGPDGFTFDFYKRRRWENGSGFKVGYKSILAKHTQGGGKLKIKVTLNKFMQKKLGNGNDDLSMWLLNVTGELDLGPFRRAPRSSVWNKISDGIDDYVEGVVGSSG
ncbi:hypothetical protein Tco_0465479 [Tanacetum coccineum]